MEETKLENLLGIAQKAGKISSGTFAVNQAINKNKAKMLLIAEDAFENTKNEWQRVADSKKIPIETILNKERLGKVIGKEYRVIAAVVDEGFCKAISDIINK